MYNKKFLIFAIILFFLAGINYGCSKKEKGQEEEKTTYDFVIWGEK